MKNIIITPRQIKRVIAVAISSLVIAFALNVYAIIKYQTHWNELYTQIGYVLLLAVFIYFIIIILRACGNLLFRLVKSQP
jgi:hypothetical protein